MQLISLRIFFLAAVAALAFLAAVPAPAAAASYGGACVTYPVSYIRYAKGRKPKEKAATQYHMRIPDGRRYNDHHNERFPGKTFYAHLKDRNCRASNFTTIYDVDGNAHVDFVVKDRRVKKCDAPRRIAVATNFAYEPDCVEGTPETLADAWRSSWGIAVEGALASGAEELAEELDEEDADEE